MTLYIGDKPVGLYKVVKDTKYIDKTKFGASAEDWWGELTEDGTLKVQQVNREIMEFNFSGVKKLSDYALRYKFYNFPRRYKLLFPDLEVIGYYACAYMNHSVNTGPVYGLDMKNVKRIEERGMYTFIDGMVSSIGFTTDVLDLDKLEYIGNYGMSNAFQYCSIGEIKLSSLQHIANYGMQSTFRTASSIAEKDRIKTPIYFPALTSFGTSPFGGSSVLCFKGQDMIPEIHFRADMQATVEALTGYTEKFGATNATIYFDL